MYNLTFDDVLIKPKFSYLNSRKDVSLAMQLGPVELQLPILSANMDTVTSTLMAIAMNNAGGLGVLHRFMNIEDNVYDFKEVYITNDSNCAVSIGLGDEEKNRARSLYQAGARILVLDVAHGAQMQVVQQYKWLKENLVEAFVIVGNFADGKSCGDFWSAMNAGGISYHTHIKKNGEKEHLVYGVDAFKIGIGPGSACTTRIKTGVGIPQFSAVLDVANYFKNHLHKPLIICDGGMRSPGDIAKALAAGADCVMLGGMLAGTDETPGDIIDKNTLLGIYPQVNLSANPENVLAQLRAEGRIVKKFRGSASKEAYSDQGKDATHRTAEGESFGIPYKGPVAQVLQDIEGGLRSAFTYVGAKNVRDFQEKAEFVTISPNGTKENGAHGKT